MNTSAISMVTLVRELWAGKSLVRIFLNARLRHELLAGDILDVGCGSDTSYLDFVPRTPEAHMQVFDQKLGATVDFEKDALPYGTDTLRTVVILNVLEHVYNHVHLTGEVYRMLLKEGRVIGFTPFLVRVHPDPHDYFRYTDEALQKILTHAGFRNISVEPIGYGPFLAALNIFILSIPRVARIAALPLCLLLDTVFLRVRKNARSIYPMGYYFTAEK